MKVWSREDAWELAGRLFPTDYEKDEASSDRAGYPTYRSTADGHYYDYICDLNDRLELNYHDRKSENIWIEEFQTKRFPTAIVGTNKVKKVFGDVAVVTPEEIRIENCEGFIRREHDDDSAAYEFTVNGGEKVVIREDDALYIRFEAK